MITTELKKQIIVGLAKARENFSGSDAKFAVSLGISGSQYSAVKNGQTERVLSDANWVSVARKANVSLRSEAEWKEAKTPVFRFITAQLAACQRGSLSTLLCDLSDIGKTFTAKHYADNNKNVVYVDCSQVKTKQRLIRLIAKEFGVGGTGRYADVYEDLVFYLKALPTPLIILDEAGDLQHDAFLEVKALWNATDTNCGYYMMGADGLRAKMSRAIDNKKVGYTELFSRFGRKYDKVVPVGEGSKEFLRETAAMIIKANAKEGTDIAKVLRGTMGADDVPSLRRIYKELVKHN